MSYAMTHLIIANEFAKSRQMKQEERGLFLLGAITPDAVHEQPHYEKWMKETSHFLPEGKEWGKTFLDQDILEWYRKLKRVYEEKKPLFTSQAELAFLQGILIHALVDDFNSEQIYGPLVMHHGVAVILGNGEYRRQCLRTDIRMYGLYPESKAMMEAMKESFSVMKQLDLPDRMGLAHVIPAANVQSYVEKMADMYEQEAALITPEEEDTKGTEIMMSLGIAWPFVKASVEECEKLLFDFPPYQLRSR